jgi:hypothetical protein
MSSRALCPVLDQPGQEALLTQGSGSVDREVGNRFP